MQISPIVTLRTWSTQVLNSARQIFFISAGNRTVTHSLPEQENSIPAIQLTSLSDELLIFIMKDKLDFISSLKLSLTCQYMQGLLNSAKELYEQRYYRMFWQWQHIKRLPKAELENCTSLIMRIYETAWTLLPHQAILGSRKYATQVIQTLLEIFPLIPDPLVYPNQIFPQGLPQPILIHLAHAHLDYCLQLLARYFTIEQISQAGVSVNVLRGWQRVVKGEYPSFLHYAVDNFIVCRADDEQGWWTFLNQLFTWGSELAQPNRKGEPALLYVLRLSFANRRPPSEQQPRLPWLLTRLVEQGAANVRDEQGNTLLLTLIKQEQPYEVIAWLVQYGQVDINVRNQQRLNALEIAIQNNDLKLVEILLRHPQLNVRARNKEGKSPLKQAIDKQSLPLLQALLSCTQLSLDTLCHDPDKIQDTRDKMLQEALSYAIKKKHLGSIALLLADSRVKVNTDSLFPPFHQQIPFHQAIDSGKLAIVQAFLKRPDLDVNQRCSGTSPLKAAIWNENGAIVQALLQDPRLQIDVKEEGEVLLSAGMLTGSIAIVQHLLAYPGMTVPPSLQDDYGALLAKIPVSGQPVLDEQLMRLPDELWVQIMQQLDPLSLLKLSATCKTWHRLYHDDRMYSTVIQQDHQLQAAWRLKDQILNSEAKIWQLMQSLLKAPSTGQQATKLFFYLSNTSLAKLAEIDLDLCLQLLAKYDQMVQISQLGISLADFPHWQRVAKGRYPSFFHYAVDQYGEAEQQKLVHWRTLLMRLVMSQGKLRQCDLNGEAVLAYLLRCIRDSRADKQQRLQQLFFQLVEAGDRKSVV